MAFVSCFARAFHVSIAVASLFGLVDASRFLQKSGALVPAHPEPVTGMQVPHSLADALAPSSLAAAAAAAAPETEFNHHKVQTSNLQEKTARTCDAHSVRLKIIKQLWEKHGPKEGDRFEAAAIESMLKQIHLPKAFHWRAFDKDADGALSESEFFSAASKALELPSSLKLMQHVSRWCSSGKIPKNVGTDDAREDVASSDEDVSSSDEARNSKSLSYSNGVSHNKGEMGHKGQIVSFHRAMERVFMRYASGPMGHGNLNDEQIKDIMRHYGVPRDFDWHVFDKNMDGKLSKQEFMNAAQTLHPSSE